MPNEYEEEIINMVKKAVAALNKSKGTAFRITDVSFGSGVDSDYRPDDLSAYITLTVQNASDKKTVKLHYYESFFDAGWPNANDGKSGADRAGKPEDRVLLRVAYSIWRNRHWMEPPQKKNENNIGIR